MDPDATLAEMLDIARADQSQYHDDIHRLAELTLAMHEWINRGGFLPAAWRAAVEVERVATAAQQVWQTYAAETGRSLPAGLADKLAQVALLDHKIAETLSAMPNDVRAYAQGLVDETRIGPHREL